MGSETRASVRLVGCAHAVIENQVWRVVGLEWVCCWLWSSCGWMDGLDRPLARSYWFRPYVGIWYEKRRAIAKFPYVLEAVSIKSCMWMKEPSTIQSQEESGLSVSSVDEGKLWALKVGSFGAYAGDVCRHRNSMHRHRICFIWKSLKQNGWWSLPFSFCPVHKFLLAYRSRSRTA